MDRNFRPFRLQPPLVIPRSRYGFGSRAYRRILLRRTHPLGRVPHGVIWASPLIRMLAMTTGRIEFVILRTGRSPPVAPHAASRRRSYARLQGSNLTLTRTFTSPIRSLCKRTNATPPANAVKDFRRLVLSIERAIVCAHEWRFVFSVQWRELSFCSWVDNGPFSRSGARMRPAPRLATGRAAFP